MFTRALERETEKRIFFVNMLASFYKIMINCNYEKGGRVMDPDEDNNMKSVSVRSGS